MSGSQPILKPHLSDISSPCVQLNQGRGKLRKLGKLGGGTYGRVYKASESTSSFTASPPGALIHIPRPQSYQVGHIIPISSVSALMNSNACKQNRMNSRADNLVAVKRNFISPSIQESLGALRELDILNRVRHHPFCISMKSVAYGQPFVDGAMSPDTENQTSDRLYFVLEQGNCDGDRYIHPDRYQVKEMAPLVNQRKLLTVQIFLAVEFLHSRGIYHRDLKPGNIICFLNPDRSLQAAKIADYGLALPYVDQPMSQANFVTLWYRAPEISLMKEYDFKSDVWSLGCILFELFSSGNRFLVKPRTDDELLNGLIERFPFPREDYGLAQQYYGNKITKLYERHQRSLPSIQSQLNYTESQIIQFNSKQLGGRPNHGSFAEFIDLLSHILVINPKERWSISQLLNHSFFDGHREFIDTTRTNFGINGEGQWIFEPVSTLSYYCPQTSTEVSVRQRGMKWFQYIYTYRKDAPMVNWYSHRIFFHAIEMFDRYLMLTEPPEDTLESDIAIWVNTFLFISSKYFRIMIYEFGLDHYAIGINSDEFMIFRDRVHEFEEIVIRDIFNQEIYRPTIYEVASEFLTETSIHHLVKLITRGQIPSGTPLAQIWSMQSDLINQINRISSPALTPTTPVVSLV